MKKFTIATILILAPLMFTNTTFADSKNHQDNGNNMSAMDMSKMKTHMDKMQSIMKQSHNTKDAKKQQELMQAHMKEMMQGMEMMNNTMMQHGEGHVMNGKNMKDSNDVAMKKRQDAMDKRMMMMQKMMKHMMDQQSMMMNK